jgi:hypothetical protein
MNVVAMVDGRGAVLTSIQLDDGRGNAKLLAIGEHLGQSANNPTYLIDWVSHDRGGSASWRPGHMVTLP